MNLVLTGMRGSGKTTIGRVFAEQCGVPFFDTDRIVEQRYGMSIPALIAEKGWEEFRAAESEALESCLSGTNVVCATGGGIVLREDNRRLMRTRGQVVLLDAPVHVLVRRLHADTQRPRLTNAATLDEEVTQVWRERKAHYMATAHDTIDAVGTIEDVVARVRAVYNKANHEH
jgi:shikimate kinase